MPLKNTCGRKGSIAQRLNADSRSGRNGNRKTNRDEVLLFKQRLADGMTKDEAREGLRISKHSAADIAAGRTWASVILMALVMLVTMGNSCAPNRHTTAVCQGVNYPLCRDVPRDYPCLCLDSPQGVTRLEAEEMRHLND